MLLVGGVLAGVALIALSSSNANASPASRLPRGWQSPEGSEHTTLPKGQPGLPADLVVERFQWHQAAAGGMTAGLYTMLTAGPDDWIVLFTPDGTSTVAPMQLGNGELSKAIGRAAGVAGL